MKQRLVILLCTVMVMVGFASTALAAGQNNLIGVVNVQYILQNYPGINDLVQQISNEKARLQENFDKQAQNMSADEKKSLSTQLSEQYAKFEQSKMEPVHNNIRKTILKVAKENNIENVVNSSAMVVGGKDLTKDVVDALKKK